MLSGRGLCDELITRPEETYRLCCVVVCDLETSRMGAPYIYDISRLRVKQLPAAPGKYEDNLYTVHTPDGSSSKFGDTCVALARATYVLSIIKQYIT